MSILGIDLGGTKLAVALFWETGEVKLKETVALEKREGEQVGELIKMQVQKYLNSEGRELKAIGVSVPGIYRMKAGTAWAPNMPGWEDYRLLGELSAAAGGIPIRIDSDRACYILGELWQGNAQGCQDAIFMAMGTGIGAGIISGGHVLRGAHDIAGAIGWMALAKPYQTKYDSCGCFEYYTSGRGLARLANELLEADTEYSGSLRSVHPDQLTAPHIFAAYESGDEVARRVIGEAVEFWGMAVANLVSIFNPEKIIMGGGVFGPAVRFIPEIAEEAKKWAQPISITKVSIEESALAGESGVYGAAFLALSSIQKRSAYAVD